MASFNEITLVTYLGRDPEMRSLPSGDPVCNLSCATNEKRKGKNGETEEIVTWFRVTVWGRQAEACSKYLQKGSQVYIKGRLRQEEYTDRDGNKRQSLEVNASDVQFLSSKSDSSERNDAAMAAQAPAEPRARTKAAPKSQEDDGWEPPF